MIEEGGIKKIEEFVKEFFAKMTIAVLRCNINQSFFEEKDIIEAEIELAEPQILIGQGGQTLFEVQRLLKMVLNKKLQKIFLFNLDINGYKKKKTEYLKNFAKEQADEVVFTKKEKILQPMSSYERRIIHAELSQRNDVVTESQGEGFERHIVIKPS